MRVLKVGQKSAGMGGDLMVPLLRAERDM